MTISWEKMSQLIKTTSEKNEFETSKTYVEHFMQNSILGQANVAKHDYMLLLMMIMMMMMNCFVVWLTDERRLALFPAGTLLEILTIANLWHAASRVWTCAEPEFRLSWMKLCSSDSGDNHYTTAPLRKE